MANRFNPLDPLGIIETAKSQIDTMATQAGLPALPSVPGLERRANEERAMVQRERLPGVLPSRLLDPLGLFNRSGAASLRPGYSHDRGV